MIEGTSRCAVIYNGSNGDATKALYAELERCGPIGLISRDLFRAMKCSARAKIYRGGNGDGKYKDQAYERKNWSMGLLCQSLTLYSRPLGIEWGWKADPDTLGFEWVLYVSLPNVGQCSFHARERLSGPDYAGRWVPGNGSAEAIIAYCDSVWEPSWHGEKPTIEEMRAVREISAAQIEIAL